VNIDFGRAILAGVFGTAVMTVIGLFAAPMMGIPPMNPAVMLAGAMGGSLVLGWIVHFMIGITLAVGYTAVSDALPGPYALRGALYGLAPFLLAQIAVMPMMGMPFFSGSVSMAMGSLIGHLMYGGVVGAIYGAGRESRRATAAA
jgi:uncharacterized membrane protein YagU involved in acid resistance